MRLLLDTHVAIWSLVAPKSIDPEIAALIRERKNEVFVSVASIWEISIKFALRKPTSPPFDGRTSVKYFEEVGFNLLSITAAHAAAVDELPPIHGDPFDRLLVAQALAEPLRLVSQDTLVLAYSDSFIRC